MLNVSRLNTISFKKDSDKLGEYECGFEAFDSATRQPFDVHFFIIGVLFLLFDAELSILFPLAVTVHYFSSVMYWFGIIFILLFVLSFLYENFLGLIR